MMEAVRQGLRLCGSSVIPALFPYMVMVNFLVGTGILQRFPAAAQAFLLGALGGYPMGARTAAALYTSGAVSREEARRLTLFCNNASPAFCLFFLGQTVFHSTRAGLLLYFAQLLGSGAVGLMVRRTSAVPSPPRLPGKKAPLASLLVQSIRESALTMVSICGFVVFFQVILLLFSRYFGLTSPFVLGLIELTNGTSLLDGTSRAALVGAGFLVSFGGLCTAAQTAAILGEAGVSCRGYLRWKLVAGVLTAILTGLGCEWAI